MRPLLGGITAVVASRRAHMAFSSRQQLLDVLPLLIPSMYRRVMDLLQPRLRQAAIIRQLMTGPGQPVATCMTAVGTLIPVRVERS